MQSIINKKNFGRKIVAAISWLCASSPYAVLSTELSRNRVAVAATYAGGVDSLELILGVLKSLKIRKKGTKSWIKRMKGIKKRKGYPMIC